jgi:hypothetical protein
VPQEAHLCRWGDQYAFSCRTTMKAVGLAFEIMPRARRSDTRDKLMERSCLAFTQRDIPLMAGGRPPLLTMLESFRKQCQTYNTATDPGGVWSCWQVLPACTP